MLLSKKIRSVLFLVILTVFPLGAKVEVLEDETVYVDTYNETINLLNSGEYDGKPLIKLSIDFKFNKINSDAAKVLAEVIGKLVNLINFSIDLTKNNLNSDVTKALGKSIGKLVNLTSLCMYLGANEINFDAVEVLAEAIGKLVNLTSLSMLLAANKINSDGFKALGKVVGKLVNLKSLTILFRSNEIGSDGFKATGKVIGKLVNLTSLSIFFGSNEIDYGRAKMDKVIGKLVNLTSIFIYFLDNEFDNELKSEIKNDFKFYIERTKKLNEDPIILDLFDNIMRGICFKNNFLDSTQAFNKLMIKIEEAEKLFNFHIDINDCEKIFFDKDFAMTRLNITEDEFDMLMEILKIKDKKEIKQFFIWLYTGIYFYRNSKDDILRVLEQEKINFKDILQPHDVLRELYLNYEN
ncbi:MAG: Protein kinase domain containing protein [candidate division TM6 bacterium GW2011_GWF2_28_16]|nr:MAG: Protein kinase domain containing protein [candidate division TM6 bacterium GW2011_GWF2_28_16]